MTEAMLFLQKNDITFLRPPTIRAGVVLYVVIPYQYRIPHRSR